jgi:hypothetical protein
MIENNKIIGSSQCLSGGNITDVEVSEELYNAFKAEPDKYMWNGSEVVENPDYEEIKQQKEQARIMEMKMTPLDFLKAIEQYGITYDMVKQFMEENPLVERELRFCQFVYRKHPMLQSLSEYGITSEILDHIFKVANGEE